MFTRHLLKGLLALVLLLWLAPGAYAQQVSLTGKVTDDKGQPLPGAGVQVRGGKGGTGTDNAGVFHLSVPSNATIIVSYVGYDADTVTLSGQTTLNVQLHPTTAALEQVVVVGYGTQRRKDVTGSIASIKGADVKSQPVTNVTEAIQGRVAGVEIVKSSGAPDAPSSILIRGVSSLNNAQPLYIVDGVRQTNGENFNMADIADINVLKDASAAAIYGSAAAGGVIIITTKKGQVGKPTINLNARYGVTKPRTLQLLDRDNWIKMKRTIDPTYLQGNDHTDTLPNTDWTKELFRDGNEQNYNLSVSGATNTANYLVSGFYNNQKGVYLNNASRLIGARVNSEFKLGKIFRAGEELYIWGRNTNPVPPFATPINPPFRTTPIMPVYNPDKTDKSNIWGQSPTGYSGPNLVGQIMTAHILNKKLNLQGNAFVEVQLPLYLTFRSTLGYTFYNEGQNYFQEPYNFGQVKSPSNKLEKYTNNNQTLLNNYTLSFDHIFGKHAINALIGYEQIQNKYDGIDASETNVGGSSFGFIRTSQSDAFVTGGYDPNGLVKSQFGRLNYNYAGKYYISGAVRRDANFTVFGPGNQHGVFPSASAGWHISDEDFFKRGVPFIDLLKLRGSWGRLGNSNINSYYFLTTYEQVNSANFSPGGSPSVGITQTFIPNEKIKWEQVEESNIGLDLEALNHRLNFTAEWYNKTTNDMLYGLPVALSSGITALYETNIGSVNNKGIDLVLGYHDHAGKFSYGVNFTGSFNKNKVLNLDGVNANPILDGNNNYGNGSFGLMINNPITITRAGAPFGQFWGYKVQGIFKSDDEAAKHGTQLGNTPHAGDLIYQDITGDGKVTADDKQVLGNPNPKFTYGASVNLAYGAFDLNLLFNGVSGVQVFNGVKAYAQFPFSDGNTTSQVFNASFFGSNQLTSQPRINYNGVNDPNQNYNVPNSYFVENGSYLKLKNAQLGYNFSNTLLTRLKIQKARLYVMANNLFTITKYSGIDPELSGNLVAGPTGPQYSVTTRGIDAPWQYPHSRVFSIGFDATF